MIRPLDVIIMLAGAVLIAVVAMKIYSQEAAVTARIMQGDRAHQDFELSRSREVRIEGPLGVTRIEISDGRARVVDSPCTQKLCIRSGWLESAGEATACVPNRVSMVLLGTDPRFDAVSF